MLRNLGASEISIIAGLLILVFGSKRLPDAARSIGRSMRVFKSEVDEMKADGKTNANEHTSSGDTAKEQPVQTEPVHTEALQTEPVHTEPVHSVPVHGERGVETARNPIDTPVPV